MVLEVVIVGVIRISGIIAIARTIRVRLPIDTSIHKTDDLRIECGNPMELDKLCQTHYITRQAPQLTCN